MENELEQQTEQVTPESGATPEAAPNAEVTATPAEAPVSGEEVKPESDKPLKTFTQEEVEELIAKRLARAERKRQREMQQVQPPVKAEPEVAPAGKPLPESFQTTEQYLEALTDWKAEQKVSEKLDNWEKNQRESRVRQAMQQVAQQHQEREEQARDRYEDYDDVAYNPALPITDAMAHAIQHSDVGPDLAYYLGTHPKEAERIARLPPLLQAKELGKMEAKLPSMATTPPAQTTNAPAPIRPVNTKTGSQPVYDTTDPRSVKTMSTSEWIAAERKRQEAKWLRAQGR